jgi:CRISPR-associated exonuclease Cas4
MLGLEVPGGALFYGRTRHRQEVVFDVILRQETEETARRLHALIDSGVTPPGQYSKRCKQCSLNEECQPKVVSSGKSVERYLRKAVIEP